MAAATVAFPCASSAACSPRFECTNAQPIIRSLTDSGVPVARSSAASLASAQGTACRWPAIERSIPAALGAVGWVETAEDPLAVERKEKQLLSFDEINKIAQQSNRNIKNALWLLEMHLLGIPATHTWEKSIQKICHYIININDFTVTNHIAG